MKKTAKCADFADFQKFATRGIRRNERTRGSESAVKGWHDVQEEPLTRVKFGPMDPHYDGPVYVLTSKVSASATEFAVDALSTINNVTIIGEICLYL